MYKSIFVHIDLRGVTQLVGRLWVRERNGVESASFEYDRAWLGHPEKFALEPSLNLDQGSFHTGVGKALFAAIGDSAPDRWGRQLLQRATLMKAKERGSTPGQLLEVDYLLAVSDVSRQGALRFSINEAGPFLNNSKESSIPPIIRLAELLSAVDRISENENTDNDLKLLLAPGSSLGGARPKASILTEQGLLGIAKFPKNSDPYKVILWEYLTLNLARDAGLTVPQFKLVRIDKRPILVIDRFDRMGSTRIPYLSAMSMLDANDGEVHSYLELVDAIRQYGAAPNMDCAELWRRIVFTVLVSNTDDHLRNHGFLYEGSNGWRLSPVFDVNPTPSFLAPRILSTSIGFGNPQASLDLTLEVAPYFGIKAAEARNIISQVSSITSTWSTAASKLGFSKREIDLLESAFEHDDLRFAETLL